MDNKKIISPCISICKIDYSTGYCYGCARTDKEKIIWKDEKTSNEWKEKNINELNDSQKEEVNILIEKLEEDEDVQNVFHNAIL